MASRISWATLMVLFLSANLLYAQQQSEAWPRSNPTGTSTPEAGPDQPVNPQLPTLQRRAAPDATQQNSPQSQSGNQVQAFPLIQRQGQTQPVQPNQVKPQPPAPPFVLTKQEEAQLDRMLGIWEQKSKDIKTFDCSFKRWEYDPIFAKPGADPNAPSHIDLGILKFAAPDKGVFQLLKTETSEGKLAAIEEDRAEHWICDGKSIFQYIPKQKQLIEHKLPPEMQGKAIVDGPLPFLFGAEAQKLRQRYFLRLMAPPAEKKNEIWLEAYPRYQGDAANFFRANLVLSIPDMTPKAMQIIQPNGKSKASYEFYDIVLNDPLRFLGNPFQAFTPRGWEKIVENPSPQQAGKPGSEKR